MAITKFLFSSPRKTDAIVWKFGKHFVKVTVDLTKYFFGERKFLVFPKCGHNARPNFRGFEVQTAQTIEKTCFELPKRWPWADTHELLCEKVAHRRRAEEAGKVHRNPITRRKRDAETVLPIRERGCVSWFGRIHVKSVIGKSRRPRIALRYGNSLDRFSRCT